MKKQLPSHLPLCLVLLLFAGCNAATERQEEAPAKQTIFSPPAAVEASEEATAVASSGAPDMSYDETSVRADRAGQPDLQAPLSQDMLIKNAQLRFQVKDFEAASGQIMQLVKQHQGYVASAAENRYGETVENHMQIRVPARQFDTLLDALLKQGAYVDRKEVTVVDVTQEHADITARLASKKAVRDRYLDLLKQAKKVEEILKIENGLREIQEEIEATEARLKVMRHQVSYSTIYLQYYQTSTGGATSGYTFGARLLRALESGWESLISFFIGLVHLWPFLLIIAFVAWLLRWLLHRRRSKA